MNQVTGPLVSERQPAVLENSGHTSSTPVLQTTTLHDLNLMVLATRISLTEAMMRVATSKPSRGHAKRCMAHVHEALLKMTHPSAVSLIRLAVLLAKCLLLQGGAHTICDL